MGKMMTIKELKGVIDMIKDDVMVELKDGVESTSLLLLVNQPILSIRENLINELTKYSEMIRITNSSGMPAFNFERLYSNIHGILCGVSDFVYHSVSDLSFDGYKNFESSIRTCHDIVINCLIQNKVTNNRDLELVFSRIITGMLTLYTEVHRDANN